MSSQADGDELEECSNSDSECMMIAKMVRVPAHGNISVKINYCYMYLDY